MNTTDRDSRPHHFEYVKQTRPFTEREYMQCTKCGHQNPLGLFQHWDTQRDGPAFKWPARGGVPPGYFSRGGYIPGPPLPVRLKDGERLWVQAGGQIVEYIHEVDNFGEQWRLRKTGRTTKRKRKPIVKLRKEHALFWRAFGYRWQWKCTVCHRVERDTTWEETYEWADRHARQHESR